MKIATTSICKNELKYIDSWYEALKDEVDYITVLDTGSTDGTYEKLIDLSKADDRLIVSQKTFTPWRFDTSRNEAMKLMPEDTDVFISIDMDETFEPGFGKVIRDNWVVGRTLQAKYRYSWNHDEDGNPIHEFTYTKICGNDGKWVWKYPIHECMVRSEKEEYTSDQILDLTSQIHLHHWQDTSVDRSNYLDMLKTRAEEYKEDIDYLYYARELVFHNKYAEAIVNFTKIFEKDTITLGIQEQAYVKYMIGVCYDMIKDEDKAIELMKESINIDPTYRDPYMDISKILIRKTFFSEAEYYLKQALKVTYRKLIWTEVGNFWGVVPYDLLSVAAFNSKDYRTALCAITKAVNIEPENESLKKNMETILENFKDEYF